LLFVAGIELFALSVLGGVGFHCHIFAEA